MIERTNEIWFCYTPLPISVRLDYITLDGQHPLTPVEVRHRYVKEVKRSALVIWQHSPTQRLGFRAGIDELTWPLDCIKGFQLSFCRPAKGSGDVSLIVQHTESEMVLSSKLFTPELLDWLRPITAKLTEMFPGKVIEEDRGYDC